jgi:hypothetical protein
MDGCIRRSDVLIAIDLATPRSIRLSLRDVLIMQTIVLDVWIFMPSHGCHQLSWFMTCIESRGVTVVENDDNMGERRVLDRFGPP